MASNTSILLVVFILCLFAGIGHCQTPSHVTFNPKVLNALHEAYIEADTNEFGGCVLGKVSNDTIYVQKIVFEPPNDAHQPCSARWDIGLGFIHSHPKGIHCSHFLELDSALTGEKFKPPVRTQIPTSDWIKFIRFMAPDPFNFIYCDSRIAWLGREDLLEYWGWIPLQPMTVSELYN